MTDPNNQGGARALRQLRADLDLDGAEADKAIQAFERWAQGISLAILKCRTSGHRFPDWDDNRKTKITQNAATGAYIINAACTRKCGVILSRFLDSDGYLTRSNRIGYDYTEAVSRDRDPDKAYQMPKGARTGHGYTKDQRAYLRRELIQRLSEWITEE